MKYRSSVALALGSCVLLPAATWAQTERGFTLQEITVTARRTEESLQSTPIAITAVSGAELEERGATQIAAVALFGRNTIGGAINVTTRQPGDSFGAQLRGTVGTDERRDLFAQVDVPLSESFRAGAAFLTRNRDGYVHRLDGVDQGGDDVLAGRRNFLWNTRSGASSWVSRT